MNEESCVAVDIQGCVAGDTQGQAGGGLNTLIICRFIAGKLDQMTYKGLFQLKLCDSIIFSWLCSVHLQKTLYWHLFSSPNPVMWREELRQI